MGDVAESQAQAWLQARGWQFLQRHYRSPGRGGGEIDLIMRAPDGTLGFIEVRLRRSDRYGGALASVTAQKRARIIWAARHFLMRWPGDPPFCRFDVVALEPDGVKWIRGAFTL